MNASLVVDSVKTYNRSKLEHKQTQLHLFQGEGQ